LKILILAVNNNKQPVTVMPYGACIVADACARCGHEVSFLDLMFSKDPSRVLTAKIRSTLPEVVGISVRNIDNHDFNNPCSFYRELPLMVGQIHRLTNAIVVLGGSAVNIMPEEFLRFSGADYAISGNGEMIFPEFLAKLRRPDLLNDLSGLAWLEEDKYFINPHHSSILPQELLVPEFARWLDVGSYRSVLATVPLLSKRGCPYKCVYCTYAMCEGKEYQLNHPADVSAAVSKLESLGLNNIEFVDNVFNSPYEHAIQVCQNLISAGNKARLQTVELNPKFVDKQLITLMEKAGFVGVGITAESASDRVLAGLGKDYLRVHVEQAAKFLGGSKFPCLWIFLLGGPGENKKTVQETINFAEQHISRKDVVFFNLGIRIYPGTEIERIARAEGSLNLSHSQMLAPVSYFSPEVDHVWVYGQIKEALKRNMNFINSDTFSLPYLDLMHRLGYMVGLKPPIWKHTGILRRSLRMMGVAI